MKLIGYKAMKFEDGMCISGADSRVRFPPLEGLKVKLPGMGLYLSLSVDYVEEFYTGLHDNEILLTFEFDTANIVSGSVDDIQTEISVSEATLLLWQERRNHEDVQAKGPGAGVVG